MLSKQIVSEEIEVQPSTKNESSNNNDSNKKLEDGTEELEASFLSMGLERSAMRKLNDSMNRSFDRRGSKRASKFLQMDPNVFAKQNSDPDKS